MLHWCNEYYRLYQKLSGWLLVWFVFLNVRFLGHAYFFISLLPDYLSRLIHYNDFNVLPDYAKEFDYEMLFVNFRAMGSMILLLLIIGVIIFFVLKNKITPKLMIIYIVFDLLFTEILEVASWFIFPSLQLNGAFIVSYFILGIAGIVYWSRSKRVKQYFSDKVLMNPVEDTNYQFSGWLLVWLLFIIVRLISYSYNFGHDNSQIIFSRIKFHMLFLHFHILIIIFTTALIIMYFKRSRFLPNLMAVYWIFCFICYQSEKLAPLLIYHTNLGLGDWISGGVSFIIFGAMALYWILSKKVKETFIY